MEGNVTNNALRDSLNNCICGICDTEVTNTEELLQHFSEHFKKIQVKVFCEICGQDFPTKTALSEHRKSHNVKNSSIYSCEHCEIKCTSKSGITAHVKSHFVQNRKYSCSHCSRDYIHLGHLEQHLRKVLKNRPMECYFCPQWYNTYFDLQTHLQKQHESSIEGSWQKTSRGSNTP